MVEQKKFEELVVVLFNNSSFNNLSNFLTPLDLLLTRKFTRISRVEIYVEGFNF